MNPTLTPTVSLSAYVSGHCVGGKLLVLDSVDQALVLQSLTVLDLDNQKPPLQILLFSAEPTSGDYGDHTALSVPAADAALIIGRLAVAAGDYVTVGGVSVATVVSGAAVLSDSRRASPIYALIATTGTPTFTAASGKLILRPGFIRA